eukprot:7099201-Prymnesium_polylepis.1
MQSGADGLQTLLARSTLMLVHAVRDRLDPTRPPLVLMRTNRNPDPDLEAEPSLRASCTRHSPWPSRARAETFCARQHSAR